MNAFVKDCESCHAPPVLRVVMSYGSAPPTCGTFSYGEVQDYAVQIP